MMLGLQLRNEFQGRRLKGTAIELTNKNNTGATQIAASDFLKITYPTADLLKTIEATGPDQGRPVTLKGERGQGKSHLMASLYHALNDNEATRSWLRNWSQLLGNPKIAELPLRSGMHVISESLHRQKYVFLWDLLFDQHPHGAYCKGKWEGLGQIKTDVPSADIILEMFQHTPSVLILDEFQTWFDGLTNTKQHPRKHWAFNFIQILSEIASEHPDLLVLVVSVRNGNTDAFQQIQRVHPVLVDFKGPSSKQDRLNLLLHRLFENRLQVSEDKINTVLEPHVSEYLRLCSIAPAEHAKVRSDFTNAWPYSPQLIKLLEDHVLMATHAQETRDLIRILADVFKRRGENTPVITAADFRLEDESSGITALLDSVANQHHAKLREKAMRNLEAVKTATSNSGQSVPHLEDIIASLWLRSLADSNLAGADLPTLQSDITRDKIIDDNIFQVEIGHITENSFNIHALGNRYLFREEENPQAKLIASARNDKLFQNNEDIDHLSKEAKYVIGGTDGASKYKVIVLPMSWQSNPWEKVAESDLPQSWDERIPVLVVPDSPTPISSRLGEWLRNHLQRRRNTVRFLLPRDGSHGLFSDRDLIILSRAIFLATQWQRDNHEYRQLKDKYQKELQAILKIRFDRFAVISNWNFQEPKNCQFHIEAHKAEGAKIPEAMDEQIRDNLFIPEDFSNLVMMAAQNNESIGKLLNELREPRPNGEDCIPWLGETEFKEKIIKVCAKGRIAINIRGMEYLQLNDGEDEETAWRRMRGKLGTGKHLDETYILLPQAVPGTSGISISNPVTPELPLTSKGELNPTNGSIHTSSVTPQPQPGNIFGGRSTYKPYRSSPTSALNLLGKAESWGISAGTQIQSLCLKVDKLTGSQLSELIKKLPDGMTYEIDLEKEES